MAIKRNETAAAAAPDAQQQQQQEQLHQQHQQRATKTAGAAENGNGGLKKKSAAKASADAPSADNNAPSNGDGAGAPPAQNAVENAVGEEGGETAAASMFEEFEQLQEQFGVVNNAVKSMTVMLKNLQKKYAKLWKASQKKQKQKRGAGAANAGGAAGQDKPANGFAKPTKLSDELCKFLKVPPGTEMGRTQVTKMLTEYVKKNNLQQEQDKRVINPDPALRGVLKTGPEDKVTYFNLQKFIKHHFVKDEATENQEGRPGAAVSTAAK